MYEILKRMLADYKYSGDEWDFDLGFYVEQIEEILKEVENGRMIDITNNAKDNTFYSDFHTNQAYRLYENICKNV